jgi:superfamily I DNA/RNA helicase
VAMTRAGSVLVMTWAERRRSQPTQGPSRFLAEAGLLQAA